MRKRFIWSVLLILVLCITYTVLLPTETKAAEILASGTCGDDLTWTLDDTGTLTISGTGKMHSFAWSPWDDYKDSIKTIIIKDGVTSIGSRAFCEFKSLTSITLPDSITHIGSLAFFLCESLTDIDIPNGVISIGSDAFAGCEKLVLNEYGNAYYLGNKVNPYVVLLDVMNEKIASCTININTRIIGGFAFEGCTSLTNVTIPDSVISIGGYAFEGCTSLTNIILPDALTSINACTFSNCTSLTDITIPDGVINIYEWAFSYCSNLTDITIPNSVTSIDHGAFDVCRKLQNVHYQGNQADWDSIKIAGDNIPLLNATIIYNFIEPIIPPTCEHLYDNTCDTVCNLCENVRDVTHSYDTSWSMDSANHWHECSVCKDKKDIVAHTPGAESTTTDNQVCTVCGYVLKKATGESEPAPQPTEPSGTEATQPESTPATPTEPATTPATPTEPVGGNKPSTDSTVWIIVAVAVVLLGGSAAGIIIWKKKH